MAKSIYEALSVSVEPDIENFLATRDFVNLYDTKYRTVRSIRLRLKDYDSSHFTITPLLPDESIAKSFQWIEEINKREEK